MSELIQAYEQTIYDFRIALAHTGLFRFKERRRLSKEIRRYEEKIKLEYKTRI